MVAAALLTLLDVQGLDTHTDQLVRRRATLSERAELPAVDADAARLADERDAAGARAHELERSQKRLEDEVASLEDKATGADRQLYSGTVTAPRELQAFQDEAASIRRRIGGLEDGLLVVMEELELVVAHLARLEATSTAAADRAAALRSTIAGEEASIDAELRQLAASKAVLAADVAPPLLAQYERIRARTGGIGIARLDGHRCTGCHLELPNREVDELRRAPADQVVLHEECARILVRD